MIFYRRGFGCISLVQLHSSYYIIFTTCELYDKSLLHKTNKMYSIEYLV